MLIQTKQYPPKKNQNYVCFSASRKRLSVALCFSKVDNIKETICHIMLSIKTQTKYFHFYCLCIAYSLSNQ